MDEYYGILFKKLRISENVYCLVPKELIKGSFYVELLVTDDERAFDIIDMNYLKKNKKEIYGFPVSSCELMKKYADCTIDKNKNIFDQLAKYYFEDVSMYYYIFSDQGVNAYDLISHKCNAVDITASFIEFKEYISLFNQIQEDIKNENKKEIIMPKLNTTCNYSFNKIFKNVKKRVIGQDEATRLLVSGIIKNLKYSDYEGMKTNILVYGPTGCGKTEIIRSIAKEIDLPMVVVDATNYTANGYVGDSISDIFKKLYISSNCDINKMQHGIVVIDEFDKIASNDPRLTVNKTDVQMSY